MTDEQFVRAIRQYVLDVAERDIISKLLKPSDRQSNKRDVKLSNWYDDLDTTSKNHVSEIAKDAAHASLFGLFCVLDGARLVDEELRNGRLQLVFEDEKERIVLSDNQAVSDLHDILNSEE